jgi:hypothetical protein
MESKFYAILIGHVFSRGIGYYEGKLRANKEKVARVGKQSQRVSD